MEEGLHAALQRPVPRVEQGTIIAVAGTLLDVPRREVLLVTDDREPDLLATGRKWRAFGGYSLIERLLATQPEDLYTVLFHPVEHCTIRMEKVPARGDLTAVLEAFKRARFGWAVVESATTVGLVTLADVLALYADGSIDTHLRLRDVASSPVFALPGGTELRDALLGMMKRRVRRVRVEGTDGFVSDREVLSYVFSPPRLYQVKESPESMFEPALEEVGRVKPADVDGGTRVKDAAAAIGPETGGFLTIDGGEMVVTPWDIVMKPWALGKLSVSRR